MWLGAQSPQVFGSIPNVGWGAQAPGQSMAEAWQSSEIELKTCNAEPTHITPCVAQGYRLLVSYALKLNRNQHLYHAGLSQSVRDAGS